MSKSCLFCKIVAGEIPARIIDQNDDFMAFLTIYPNTPGCTVVIPKQHVDSYFIKCPADLLNRFMAYTKSIATLLDSSFEDVGRTALVFEGYGVDHLHAKLFPMHGTPKEGEPWREIKSNINLWTNQYLGYISSHDCSKCSDEELELIHKKIMAKKALQRTPTREDEL